MTVRYSADVAHEAPPHPPSRIGAVVLARMSSRRLPGKALADLGGRPLLLHVADSLHRCRSIDDVVVATSDDPRDDPIAEWCGGEGMELYRGPLEDVAGRLAGAAHDRGLSAVVRISGDSPLIDHRLVDQAVEMMRDGPLDAVTNVDPRSFPAGQSVEVLTTDALGRVIALGSSREDREHVTPPLYRHAEHFRLARFAAEPSRADRRMVVDTPDDLAAARDLLAGLPRPHHEYGWEELLARMERAAA